MKVESMVKAMAVAGVPSNIGIFEASTAILWIMNHTEVPTEIQALQGQIDDFAKKKFGKNWYHDWQSKRTYCDRCSESYRRENLIQCEGCAYEFCYRCEGEHSRNCLARNQAN